MNRRALVLFAHGARDPAWAAPFLRLQTLLQSQDPSLTVALAFLELMAPDLPVCVGQLLADGADDITVVPVFLGLGGHVKRDLPQLIEQLRVAHPSIAFHVAAPVGEDDGVLAAIAQYCAQTLAA